MLENAYAASESHRLTHKMSDLEDPFGKHACLFFGKSGSSDPEAEMNNFAAEMFLLPQIFRNVPFQESSETKSIFKRL